MNTRSILILTAILLFGVLVTIGLVSQSTSNTKTDSSRAAEGATGLGAKSIKLAPDTQSQPPTVNVEKSDLQPVPGEKVESSEIREIRQALSELLALEEGVGSNQQIQEKKAALKAAVERGIKKDPKSVLKLLFGFTQMSDNSVGGPSTSDEVRSFIQRAPELAIALLDQVPNEFGRSLLLESIGSAWAESDLKAAFAWANQQTDSKIKNAILEGVISSWAKTDLQRAFAYAQSLPPGDSQDRTISKVFQNAAQGAQGALAMMQSLPEGRTKDLAAKGISDDMSFKDPRAAWDLASGIGDFDLRTEAQEKVGQQLQYWASENPAAATRWVQSLPEGAAKDRVSWRFSRKIAQNDPQAAFDIASGIGSYTQRTEAQEYAAGAMFLKDPAAATQWMQSLPEGRTKDLAASGISSSMFYTDPQAAMDMASGISDTSLRTAAQEKVVEQWSEKNPAAATQWMQSLPEGRTKDLAASGISQSMVENDPQAAMDMASGIGDSNLRTEAQKNAARAMFSKDPAAAIQWIQSLPVGQTKDIASSTISKSIVEKDPQAAMDMATGIGDSNLRTKAQKRVAMEWSEEDPAAAIQWMQSLPVGQTKDIASSTISKSIVEKDPQAAMDMASGIGDSNLRTEAQENVVEQWSKNNPAAAAQWMQSLPEGRTKNLAASGISQSMAEKDPQAAMDMAKGIGDTGIRAEAETTVATAWMSHDPAAAIQWMQSLPVGQTKDSALLGFSYHYWNNSNPQAAFDMASGIGDTGIRTEEALNAARDFFSIDPAAAIPWLQSLPEGPTKDLAVGGISQGMAFKAPQVAMDMASGIGDSNLRTEAQKDVVEQWSKIDPAAATQWINRSALPQEVKTQLLQR